MLNFTGNTTLTGTGSVFVDDWSPNAIPQHLRQRHPHQQSNHRRHWRNRRLPRQQRPDQRQHGHRQQNPLPPNQQHDQQQPHGSHQQRHPRHQWHHHHPGRQRHHRQHRRSPHRRHPLQTTISGGTISGNITVLSNSTFSNLTVDTASVVVINPAVVLNYSGATFTNNGLIQIDTFSSSAALNFTGNTTLAGSGTVFLDDYNPNASHHPAAANATLTNNQTIHGIGEIDIALINNGTITGDFSTGSRTLNINGHTTNNALIQANNNGIIQFGVGAILNNGTLSGGTFRIDPSGTMIFSDPIATNAATILLTGANATVTGLASLASNTGNLTLQNGAALTLNGPVTNTGNVALTGANTTLTISGGFTNTTGVITGNGTLAGHRSSVTSATAPRSRAPSMANSIQQQLTPPTTLPTRPRTLDQRPRPQQQTHPRNQQRHQGQRPLHPP